MRGGRLRRVTQSVLSLNQPAYAGAYGVSVTR